MLPKDDTTVHNKFHKPDKLLSPFHAVALEMEKGVTAEYFTAWSCATPESLASCFFADEACPSAEGLSEPEGPFHPAFDLGSLTKPLFLNSILRKKIAQRPEILLEPVLSFLKPRNETGKTLEAQLKKHSHLRLVDFLDHLSGLKSWFWFGRGQWAFKTHSNESLVKPARAHLDMTTHHLFEEAFCKTLLTSCFEGSHEHPQHALYSDPNYFVLARILENLSFLPEFEWKAALHELNADFGTEFFHASISPLKARQAIPFFPYISTQNSEAGAFEHPDTCFGSVLDSNANILSSMSKSGGLVSGHAGLFGSIADVQAGVEFLAQNQRELRAHPALNSYFKKAWGKDRFVLGLDTPSSANTLAGMNQWPIPEQVQIFGHLGFTGTSFWFSVSEQSNSESHVLLTNRTAARTCYGASAVPRIFVQTHFLSGHSQYFMRLKKENWRLISEDTAFELMQSHRQSTNHIWDQSTIRQYPNIAAFRQFAGKNLWPL